MQSFKNILVLHSSGSAVLERAIALAQANDARLTVVDVTKNLESMTPISKPGMPPIDVQGLVMKKLNEQLKQVVASIPHDKPRIKTKVLVGSPSLEIVREVIRGKYDLVILGSEGKGGVRERLFGSNALHLMRTCPCAVLVVDRAHSGRSARILAAVDVDPGDETKSSLNARIIELARSLASMEGAELHLLHAWILYGEGLLEGLAGLDASDVHRIVADEAIKRRELVETLARQHNASNATLHVVKGEASEVIPDMVKSQAIDMLVMGTVCRTGVAGFFIGNTAETVLGRVNCSVLAIKPEGFVSPVKAED